MRVNVYNEEITGEVELVETTADTGLTYYGARMYLVSADTLHDEERDDDRSAVTLWFEQEKDAKAVVESLSVILS